MTTNKGMTTMANKPVALSLGTKKRTYKSIKQAAMEVTAKTGEPFNRVYMRLYMRYRKLGWKGASAVNRKPRKYNRKPLLMITYQPWVHDQQLAA